MSALNEGDSDDTCVGGKYDVNRTPNSDACWMGEEPKERDLQVLRDQPEIDMLSLCGCNAVSSGIKVFGARESCSCL